MALQIHLQIHYTYSFESNLSVVATSRNNRIIAAMSQWQPVDFNPQPMIPPRDCVVQTTDRLRAYLEISFWVREQGIRLENYSIHDLSMNLLLRWEQRPPNSEVQFRNNGNAGVLYAYVD